MALAKEATRSPEGQSSQKEHCGAETRGEKRAVRAYLSGLLIDRIEIATVDLTAALARAEKRVLDVSPLPSSSSRLIEGPADIESESRS